MAKHTAKDIIRTVVRVSMGVGVKAEMLMNEGEKNVSASAMDNQDVAKRPMGMKKSTIG